jgi:hypothetical protein
MGTINRRTTVAKFAASLTMALLVTLSFGGNADKTGQEYTETGFKRALITFASARAINGLISVAQGTEVAIQPGGIGAVLTPGEILDPINDLVEQFSQVMLFSTVVLGTQKLLIEMSGWIWFSVLLACVVLFCLATLWLPGRFTPGTQRFALGLSGILLLLRFLVPVAAIANEAVFDLFLAPGYEEANRHLEDATRELGSEDKSIVPIEDPTDADHSLLDALGDFYESAMAKADVGAKLEALKTAANNTAENIIDLIVLFMIQTLLLPLFFAWLGYSAAKSLVRYALKAPHQRQADSSKT